ncbi:hypothetical protein EBZ02_07295, partial [bacterium]|nr:hypothetical protein [bacterium]
GSVVTWGAPSNGGDSSAVAGRLADGVVDVVSSSAAFAALKTNGEVVTWGSVSEGSDSSGVSNAISSGVIQLVANRGAFAALKTNGAVVTWGRNEYGGDSSTTGYGLSNGVVRVVPAAFAFAALKDDGSVVTWGDATQGGDAGVMTSHLTSGVQDLFAVPSAFAALKSDGSVVAWGDAVNGGDTSAVNDDLGSGVVTLTTPYQNNRWVAGNALGGVALVSNAATAGQGIWQYSTNGFHWSNVPANPSASSALVLDNDTQLRFAPASGFVGYPGALTVRLIEVEGTNQTVLTGLGRDVSASGGTNRVSAQTVALTTTVYGIAPELSVGLGLNGTVSTPLSYAVSATGTTPIRFSASNLPVGLSMDTNGIISGTPTLSGNDVAIVAASNSYGVVTNTLAWAITKITPLAPSSAPTATSIIYGQALSNSVISGGVPKTSTGAGIPGAWAFVGPSTKPNAGSGQIYTAIFTPDDTTTFETLLMGVSLTVNKATPVITGLAANDTKTYGNSDYTLSVTRGLSSSPLVFSSTQTNVATISSVGLVTIRGAGQTTLKVNQAGDSNYLAATEATQVLTVAKATPVLSGLSATAITNGQALSASTVTGTAKNSAGADVAGIWSFQNPGNTPSVGTNNQGVTFTPDDSANYETVSTTVAVTVTARIDFTYSMNNGEVTITGYTGTGGNVVIPGTIEGNPVTSIAGGAFLG